MGERDAGPRRGPERGGDARNDKAGDAVGGERLELLATTADYKRIAALETGDALAWPASSTSSSLMRACCACSPGALPTKIRCASRGDRSSKASGTRRS